MDADQIVNSSTTRLAYFAVLLFLVVLIVYHLREASSEGMVSGTPGANARFQQEFSGTNQNNRNTVLTADVAASTHGDASNTGYPNYGNSDRGEQLVNGRGEPDFWEIQSELAAYKRSQAPHLSRVAGQEHMGNGLSKQFQLEDDALSTLLTG